MAKSSLHVDKLSKFLSYVLGTQPDEFGLVPDSKGFVGIKELLQAINEEPGWRHIRMAHLNEVLLTPEKPTVEVDNSRIRAAEHSRLPVARIAEGPPKLLYTAIRSRAYPTALEKGLAPTRHPHLILSPDMAMAIRIGRRHDNNPTLLTVQVAESIKMGTCFQQYGRLLYLADTIYPGSFSGPPLPKGRPDSDGNSAPAKTTRGKTPGSYYPNLESPQVVKHHISPIDRHKEPAWKKARRQGRKHKAHLNKP